MAPFSHAAEIFMLRAEVEGILPPIWRRLAVPVGVTFDFLHQVLQAAFSWECQHLYEFDVEDEKIAPPDPDQREALARDSRFARLKDLLRPGDSFLYRYDFGDNWIHLLKVERQSPPDPSALYPLCLAGERAGPPEDSGGLEGYEEIIAILSDPRHPEHASIRRLTGATYDPESFELHEVNARLRKLGERPRRRKRPINGR